MRTSKTTRRREDLGCVIGRVYCNSCPDSCVKQIGGDTEIACHRAQLADCGSAYAISRGLRSRLDRTQRESISTLLTAVAKADGCFCTLEHHEIAQIAGELGIDPGEVFDRE